MSFSVGIRQIKMLNGSLVERYRFASVLDRGQESDSLKWVV